MKNMHYLIKYLKFEKTVCFILVLIFANSLSFAQEQGASHVVNYSYKTYYASEQNWGAVEGDNGMLYFANGDGVLEYDGVNWRLIELPNQSVVRVLVKDSSGVIYVGGNNEFGYLSTNNKGELEYVSLVDKAPKTTSLINDVWSIKLLDDAVYFFSYKHMFILENDNVKLIEAEGHFVGSFSYNHQMYFTADMGLYKIQNDLVVSIPFGDFFNDKNIWDYVETKDHKILGLDSDNTFYTIDLSIENVSSAEDFIYKSHFEISKQLKGLEVYSYKIFDDGTFGFATFSGFYHISENGELIQKLNSKLNLLSDIIWDIYQDSSGLLWLCTDNGISKVDINSQLYCWKIAQGVSGRPLDLLRIDNTLFVASLSGMQYVESFQVVNAEVITNDCENFLSFKNPENPLQPRYLVSTYDQGVIELNNKDKSTFLFKIYAWKMVQSNSKPSLVYLGAEDGLYVIEFKNSKWHELGKISGIDAEIIDVVEDEKGSIWLGSQLNGVFKIDPSENPLIPNKITQYGLEDNLPSLKQNIPFHLNGQMFFGTSKGLYSFSETQNIFVADSLFGIGYCNGRRKINSLRIDSANRVWISGDKNGKTFFSVAKPNTDGSYTVVKVPFASMNNAVVELLYVESDSTIWFGGPEGLYKFKGEVPQGPVSYPCYIRKVELKKDSIIYLGPQLCIDRNTEHKKVNIDFNLNVISFKFASPFFCSEDLTRYQTWLEGFEDEWSEWSKDTEIDYLNLKEGDYKFHVRAKNAYGTISEEDVFQFTILPPWHRTWWAFILYGILVLVIVYLIIRLNSVRMKRKNELLKQIVKERTADIFNQKEKLQIQAAELKESNDKLNLLNSTKDKFFTIISHDLKSPFNSILGFTNLLVDEENSFDDIQRKEIINLLNISSQNAYDLLVNLLDWARTQTGRIEINKELLNLKELVETSIAPYKDNASKKNIEIILNISPDIMLYIDQNTSNTFIANLVNNAIKFTPEGGTITINAYENEDNIKLHIIDTGVGMSSEVIEKLFRIDENMSTPGTNNEKGTGLGLILCKEFIGINGGDISVISEVGKGSEFIITLKNNN